MLSSQYRLRMESICGRIARREEVLIEDMIWAQKLAKSNGSAEAMLRRARRTANNPEMKEGSLDDFMNAMDLGDPDPSNHRTGFTSADDIIDFFRRDPPDDWKTRD